MTTVQREPKPFNLVNQCLSRKLDIFSSCLVLSCFKVMNHGNQRSNRQDQLFVFEKIPIKYP